MATFEDLLQHARPGLKECPDFSIVAALRRATLEFCQQTEAWTVDLDPIPLAAGVAVYDLPLESGSLAERIKVAKVSGNERPLHVATPNELRASIVGGIGGVVALAMTPDAASIEVYRTPAAQDVGRTLAIRAVLAPRRDARSLPDHLAARWHDAIVAGAQASLQRVPGNPWTNPGAAALAQMIFDEEIAKARRVYMTGHGAQQRLRVRPLA